MEPRSSPARTSTICSASTDTDAFRPRSFMSGGADTRRFNVSVESHVGTGRLLATVTEPVVHAAGPVRRDAARRARSHRGTERRVAGTAATAATSSAATRSGSATCCARSTRRAGSTDSAGSTGCTNATRCAHTTAVARATATGVYGSVTGAATSSGNRRAVVARRARGDGQSTKAQDGKADDQSAG